MEQAQATSDRCMRCNRILSNPHSIARSRGPVCYKKSGGADDKEWARREELLKAGGAGMRKTIAAFAGSKRDFNRYLTDMRACLKEHPEMDKFIWVNGSC